MIKFGFVERCRRFGKGFLASAEGGLALGQWIGGGLIEQIVGQGFRTSGQVGFEHLGRTEVGRLPGTIGLFTCHADQFIDEVAGDVLAYLTVGGLGSLVTGQVALVGLFDELPGQGWGGGAGYVEKVGGPLS